MRKTKSLLRWMLTVILLVSVLPAVCFAASEIDPRDAIPAPNGTDAVLFYYRNIRSNQYNGNGNTVSNNANLDSDIALVRYIHYWAWDKWTVAAQVIQPFGYEHAEVAAAGLNQTTSGIGDTIFSGAAWYNLKADKDNMFWVALALYVVPPTGSYDHNNLINLGSNSWNFRVEFFPVVWKYNNFTLEIGGGVDFYTDNNDYTPASYNLEQDVIWTIQTHVTYDITKTFWIGGSYYRHSGGDQTISKNAFKQDLNNSVTEDKVMGTLGIHLTPQTQLLLQYATDLGATNNGFTYHAFQTRLAYFW